MKKNHMSIAVFKYLNLSGDCKIHFCKTACFLSQILIYSAVEDLRTVVG